MQPAIGCVTLPVDDLQRSAAFYRDGIALDVAPEILLDEKADHMPITLPGGHYLVLTLRSDFDTFTEMAKASSAPPHTSSCILSYFATSRGEVETILDRCRSAGGTVPHDPRDENWG